MRRLQRVYSRSVAVLVAPRLHPLDVRRALNAGACGCVAADEVERTLAATVYAVHAGQICAPRPARRAFAKPSFSLREKQVVALVATGATNAQIAARLYLSESTVKSHIASVFDKLGVHSRNDIAAVILDPEEGLSLTALPAGLPIAGAGGVMISLPLLQLDHSDPALLEELMGAVGRVAAKGAFTLGDEVADFEREFAGYCEARARRRGVLGHRGDRARPEGAADRPRRRGDRAGQLVHRERRGCQPGRRDAALRRRRSGHAPDHSRARRAGDRAARAGDHRRAPVRGDGRPRPDPRARCSVPASPSSRTPRRRTAPASAAGASAGSATPAASPSTRPRTSAPGATAAPS